VKSILPKIELKR